MSGTRQAELQPDVALVHDGWPAPAGVCVRGRRRSCLTGVAARLELREALPRLVPTDHPLGVEPSADGALRLQDPPVFCSASSNFFPLIVPHPVHAFQPGPA